MTLNGLKTHCRRGHEYTPDNTRRTEYPKGVYHRACRTCEREALRRERSTPEGRDHANARRRASRARCAAREGRVLARHFRGVRKMRPPGGALLECGTDGLDLVAAALQARALAGGQVAA